MQGRVFSKAYFIGTHSDSYRVGEPAEIIGVAFYVPEGHAPIACYHVRYIDGMEDYKPISDNENHEIVNAHHIKLSRK